MLRTLRDGECTGVKGSRLNEVGEYVVGVHEGGEDVIGVHAIGVHVFVVMWSGLMWFLW